MSRHLLVDRPRLRVIVGFDHPLRSFFGLLVNPAADPDHVLDGWPTRTGLGVRMPPETAHQARTDLGWLCGWVRKQQPVFVWREPEATAHLGRLIDALLWEWEDGTDHTEIPVPACLQGER